MKKTIRRLVLVNLLLVFTFSLSAQSVTLNYENVSLKVVFASIKKQTGLNFSYSTQLVNPERTVSISVINEPIETVVKQLLIDTNLTFEKKEKNILLFEKPKPIDDKKAPRSKKITGLVTDKKGEPIIGASIFVKGTKTGTVSDINGNFSLDALDNSILVVSYIGYSTIDYKIGIQTKIEIQLEEDSKSLDEVVVVGYGTQKKKVLTGATVQVKGTDMQNLNTVSPMDALRGLSPGVSITKTDGQPGAGFKVTIRGLGTIGNASPLFIVDGMAVENIDYLSPSEIESVDILKDATAAIYGSRAANGVVLVTTKHGKEGQKPSISYDGYTGWQNVYKKANALNAQDYMAIMNEARVNSLLLPYDITGSAPSLNISDNGALVPIVPNANGILAGTNKGTNWMDAMTVINAPIQHHSLSITGGGKLSSYSLGVSYVSQDGIIGKPVASNYDRYNFNVNMDNSLITNKDFTILKVGETLTYFYDEKSGIGTGGVYGNNIFDALETNPFLPVYDDSGNYHYAIPWNSSQVNPIAKMVYQNGYNEQKNHNMVGNLYTEIQPIKNLIYRTSFGINMSANSSRSYTPVYNLGPGVTNTKDITFQRVSDGLGWTFNNTLSYNFTTKQNNFSALLGMSAERGGLGGSYMYGLNSNSTFNDFEHAYLSNNQVVYNDGSTVLKGGPWGISSLISYFGRLNYDYKSTYLFSAMVRTDGSSRFAEGHRWGTFPALSAGWVLTNEPFMNKLKWIDFLKLRVSWGQNGNQSISPFQYLSTISSTNVKYFFGTDKNTATVGAYPNILPNPNITWETSEQGDIGIDFNCLANRLTITLDLYNKMTKGWLVQVPLQGIYGTNPPYMNGGDIQNRGYEVAFGWRDHIGELSYSVNTNMAYNHNEVTRIANNSGIIHGPVNVFRTSDEWYRAQVGYPIGYFYGYKTNGIFQTEADVKAYKDKNGTLVMPNAQPGDVRFVDYNGDGKVDGNDRTMIGDPHPAYTYGISLTLKYKGFDFSGMGSGVGGNQIAQATTFINKNDMLGNYTTDIIGRWHGEGTSNFLPRVVIGNSINTEYFSQLYIRSGDFFRITNVTLGYDFKKLFQNLPLQQIRFYATIQNLFTFTRYTGMDPEVGYAPSGNGWGENIQQGIDLGAYPSPRTVLIGASVKF